MRNFKLTLSYDGSRYKGWQKLGSTDNTIQQKVEETLSRITGEQISVHGSGRTDAGVHARAQVCSFQTETALDVNFMLTKLRQFLPEDMGAEQLEEVDGRFHARYQAKQKCYVYRVWNSDAPNVFERKYLYRFAEPLDLPAMREAAAQMLGRRDFACFSTRAGSKKSTVRTLKEIRIERLGDELRFTYIGDGFLYNMVRILTGTLLEVGLHRLSPADISRILSDGQRRAAGFTVPPRGLCLWEVTY